MRTIPQHHKSEPLPNVPLPPGAYADIWEGGDDGPRQRVIHSFTRGVEGVSGIEVHTAAVQYEDGSLDQSSMNRPSVWVHVAAETMLSSRQARNLADELVEAADELDVWTGRAPDQWR